MINLKALNRHVWIQHFDTNSIQQGDWLLKLDLKECLPVGSNVPGAPKVPEILTSGPIVPVSSTTKTAVTFMINATLRGTVATVMSSGANYSYVAMQISGWQS